MLRDLPALLSPVAAKLIGPDHAALAAKFAVFVFGGTVGLSVKLGVTYILSAAFGFWQMLAYSIGLAANIVFNFVFHRHITFAVKSQWQRRFAIFTAVTLLVVAADWLLVFFFAEKLGYNIYVVGFFVTLILSFVNFAANRLFVFAK